MDLITSKELYERTKKGEHFYLIDVREAEEYERYHLPEACNIPEQYFDKLFDENDTVILNDIREICRGGMALVLYCDRGNASMLIAKKLMNYGIDAYSLYGGVNEYKKYIAYHNI